MSILQSLLGPKRGFDGGLFLPENKSVTARRPIEHLSVDGPLHVPLMATRDLLTQPIVSVGQQVLGGERLAEPIGPDSIPVHAPTSGKIVAIDRTWSPLDGYLPCAVLEPDGRDELTGRHIYWQNESFIVQIAAHGVLCRQPRRAAHRVILDAVAAGATVLIVNAMETEPYLTSDLRTLVEQPGRIMDATCEVADAIGAARAIIALPYRHRRVVKNINWEGHGRQVEIATLANAYPQCHPTLLVKTLLDEEIEPGGDALDAGALVLPLATLRCIAEALIDDRPVTHAVMTVAGECVERPGTYRVAIGTPLRRLSERLGLKMPVVKAVVGGSMTGTAVVRADAVVTADMNGLLLLPSVERFNPLPCTHCGWCVEDCPVGIDPPSLMHLDSKPGCNEMERSELRACIDCSLCTYVCPSHLPLAETMKRMRWRFDADPATGVSPST